jgi:tetratricopeptide (TPR) repeat protein
MNSRLETIAVVAALVVVIVMLSRWTRHLSSRARLRSRTAARRLDALADSTVYIVAGATVLCLAAALLPQSRLPGGLDRAWLVGTTIGLATGIPFAVDRRSLRRRLRDLPVPDDPVAVVALAGAAHAPAIAALAAGDHAATAELLRPALDMDPPDPEAMRIRALSAAASGEVRVARAYALRVVQVDRRRWDALVDTGLALCRRQQWGEGLRLLHRAVEVSDSDSRAELALAQGQAMAGRLRDAVAALDRSRRKPTRAPASGMRR